MTINGPSPKALAIISTLFFSWGCGEPDPLDRQRVTGTVTLDGLPLRDGAVMLEPLAGSTGTAVGATIADGQFMIERNAGPSPGLYKVRIYSSSRSQAPARPGASPHKPLPMIDAVSQEYNSLTRLRAEIVSGGPNLLKYELASGGSQAP